MIPPKIKGPDGVDLYYWYDGTDYRITSRPPPRQLKEPINWAVEIRFWLRCLFYGLSAMIIVSFAFVKVGDLIHGPKKVQVQKVPVQKIKEEWLEKPLLMGTMDGYEPPVMTDDGRDVKAKGEALFKLKNPQKLPEPNRVPNDPNWPNGRLPPPPKGLGERTQSPDPKQSEPRPTQEQLDEEEERIEQFKRQAAEKEKARREEEKPKAAPKPPKPLSDAALQKLMLKIRNPGTGSQAEKHFLKKLNERDDYEYWFEKQWLQVRPKDRSQPAFGWQTIPTDAFESLDYDPQSGRFIPNQRKANRD